MVTPDPNRIQVVMAEFASLPGKTAYFIGSDFGSPGPPPRVYDSWNYLESLFCASSFKVFVLAAYLHYAERGELPNQPPQGAYPSLLEAALAEPLPVDASHHTQSSMVFGYEFPHYPTGVTGTTSAVAILAAMMAYSDNTATDIAMKRVGVANVRRFMYETAGLDEKTVRIPDSTQAFYKYLSSGEHHLINDKETMVCTAYAFDNFYWQALTKSRNRYFKEEETRRQFKSFLSMSDAIPRGVTEDTICYMKGGMADYEGEHAMASAGQAILPLGGRDVLRVQFSMLYNWNDSENSMNDGVKDYITAFKKLFDWLSAFALELR